MAKTFTLITENQQITAVVAQKTTLVNASPNPLYLTDDATDAALNELPYEAKQAVLNSLYNLAPGASKSLQAGSYNLSFSMPWANLAVLAVETSN